MKSPELQKLTASEPLTLYEEYKMQQTWLNDKNSKWNTTICPAYFITIYCCFQSVRL